MWSFRTKSSADATPLSAGDQRLLAVLLNRGRVALTTPRLAIDDDWSRIRLELPAGQLESHPLTTADLRRERSYMKGVGIRVEVAEVSEPLPETLD